MNNDPVDQDPKNVSLRSGRESIPLRNDVGDLERWADRGRRRVDLLHVALCPVQDDLCFSAPELVNSSRGMAPASSSVSESPDAAHQVVSAPLGLT